MRGLEAALRRASEVVDVPGTPRSLFLDGVEVADRRVRLSWSFADPEVLPGDRPPHGRRIRGETVVSLAQRSRVGVVDVARSCWAEAQLAAARRYRLQVDADWVPGQPYVRQHWGVAEAWDALLTHLGQYGAVAHVDGGEIRAVRGAEETVYRIDPEAWAAFLNGVDPDPPEESEVVPAGVPLADGLPLWATDELDEAAGAWGPVVGLVDGRLVGLEVPDG